MGGWGGFGIFKTRCNNSTLCVNRVHEVCFLFYPHQTIVGEPHNFHAAYSCRFTTSIPLLVKHDDRRFRPVRSLHLAKLNKFNLKEKRI